MSEYSLTQSPSGWRSVFSTKELFQVRTLTIIAMMLAMNMLLSRFIIDTVPGFRLLTLTYLPGLVVASLFGPWAALLYSVPADFLSFISTPSPYAYFPGYILWEMLGNFIYACFLYRQGEKPIKEYVARVVIARLLVTILVFFGLGFLWQSMLMGTAAGAFYSSARLIKNLVQFPVHVLIITYIGRFVHRLNKRTHLN